MGTGNFWTGFENRAGGSDLEKTATAEGKPKGMIIVAERDSMPRTLKRYQPGFPDNEKTVEMLPTIHRLDKIEKAQKEIPKVGAEKKPRKKRQGELPLKRTISKAGPRLDDVTVESDRGKFNRNW